MMSMACLRFTIARTAHHSVSSSALTVGDLNPGVMASAAANCDRGMLYSRSE